MSVTVEKILETFPDLVHHLAGDRGVTPTNPCSQNHPTDQGIAYVADEEYLPTLLSSGLSVLVVQQKIANTAQTLNKQNKTLLMTKNTYLAMALINDRFFSLPFIRKPFDGHTPIHPSAHVAKSSRLGRNIILGPGVVISTDVEIGDNCFIGAYTTIEPKTKLGSDCYIHPHVYIGHSCSLGNRIEIKPFSVIGSDGYGYSHDEKGNHYRIPHYGSVRLDDDVHIGANVNIDRGTFDIAHIGQGTKIDNHCHLGHNIQVGKNCLITAGIIVAGSTKIGDNCVFAGRVSVNGHIDITSGCTFGPMTGINNDITEPGVYAGYPAMPFKKFLRSQASIPALPQIRRKLTRIMKHLGLKDDDSS